jgi:hypothetical protein
VKCLLLSVTFEMVCFETSCGYIFEDGLVLVSKEKMAHDRLKLEGSVQWKRM